jgi:hypothetical protein
MPRCSSCGEWVEEDQRFCGYCGLKIPDETDGSRWDQPDVASEETETPDEGGERRTDAGRASDDLAPPKRESVLEFVLGHPLRRGHRPVLVSAALLLGGVLVLPALLLAGYSYRVGRGVVLEEERPPEYGNWGRLLMDGIRLVIVVSLPTLLWTLGTVLLLGVVVFLLPVSDRLVPLVSALSGVGLLWFLGAYVVAFVGNDSVVSTFLGGRARTVRADPSYLGHWLLVVVLTVVTLVAALLVAGPALLVLAADVGSPALLVLAVPTLGGLALVFGFAVLVGLTYAGYIYHGAADRGVVPPPAANPGMSPGAVGFGRETDSGGRESPPEDDR